MELYRETKGKEGGEMSYKVHDGKRGHIFATLDEASRYAADLFHYKNEVVAVTETKAKPTHIYKTKG